MTGRYAQLLTSPPDLDALWAGPAAAKVAGITYRQLDYWTTQGYLRPDLPAAGSGSRRGYGIDEITRAAAIRQALRAGMVLTAAVGLADHDGIWQSGAVTITIDVPAVRAAVMLALQDWAPLRYRDRVSGRGLHGAAPDG